MENLKIMDKFWENKKKLTALGLGFVLATTCLTGCVSENITNDATALYDVISQEENENWVPQELEVPGEDFKLVTEYSCDENSKKTWTITADKTLYITAYTKGLPENTRVWIDNVHIDTSIISSYEEMNGIMQDTMDDRIHNSQMMGFPISDDTEYYGVNAIEGSNETFINGSFYGFYGYASGNIEQERYTEEDYLEAGVYANKISAVYDLLIQDADDLEPRSVSVSSDIVVLASNQITKVSTDGSGEISEVKVYEYDRLGHESEVASYSKEEYEQAVEEGKILKKTL